MPELPEVETIKNILKELTVGKTISSIEVLRTQTIDGDPKVFINDLKGQTIESFERIGKFIIFHLTNDLVLISHLRMEGKFFLKEEKAEATKHDLVIFHFADKTRLVYNDTRRFGRMRLSCMKDYKNTPPLSHVGPDPFTMDNAERLIKKFKNKTIAIKTALLDQSIMSGLGNIYVDEVLFETKIHPLTPANKVSKAKLEEILIAAKKILEKACVAGGTTIKSYHPKEGVSGNFQVDLKVYGKKGKPCQHCGTPLTKIFVNGRGTTFCPKCQKNPAKVKVIGLTGPIAAGKSTASHVFKKLGYKTIDCDEIVHNLYNKKAVRNQLIKIVPELKIDFTRNDLKTILIKNKQAKKDLETYIHDLVKIEVEKEISHSTKPIIIEAPLLFEAGFDKLCDEIVFINASLETQKRNLKLRKSDVESSLKLNESFNKENIKKATIVIDNDKDVAHLENKIKTIFCK